MQCMLKVRRDLKKHLMRWLTMRMLLRSMAFSSFLRDVLF